MVNFFFVVQLWGFVNDCIEVGYIGVVIKGQERICISVENNNRVLRFFWCDIEVFCN